MFYDTKRIRKDEYFYFIVIIIIIIIFQDDIINLDLVGDVADGLRSYLIF
jgi:hypothetical protein